MFLKADGQEYKKQEHIESDINVIPTAMSTLPSTVLDLCGVTFNRGLGKKEWK